MKICIDGLGVSRLYGTGLYSYTFELLSALLSIYPQPQYKILWEGPSRGKGWEKYNNLSYIELPINRKQNDYTSLEEYLTGNKIQLYHSPNNGLSLPLKKVCKYIISVHDLFPVRYGEYTDAKYLGKFQTVFPGAVTKCDMIIAPSYFIKRELQRYFEIPEEKIHVIYPGCAMGFHPGNLEESRAVIKEKYGIEGDFILYAGSVHERKNLPMLMKAFRKVRKEADRLKLIIAGKTHAKRQEYFLKLKKLAEQLEISDSVVFTDIVDYTDMPCLYNASKCAVNLSIYEGFPLVTIEAMACGTPVICMRPTSCEEASSFEEAAGDGASYINAGDEDALKDLILKIIYNNAYREEMIERGTQQSRKFNTEASAKKIISIYESAAYGGY